jgi:hypothetical protein
MHIFMCIVHNFPCKHWVFRLRQKRRSSQHEPDVEIYNEAISKKSFGQSAGGGQVSVLDPRFNSSEYLRMRVEDPVSSRSGLNLSPVLILSQNPVFEMVSC